MAASTPVLMSEGYPIKTLFPTTKQGTPAELTSIPYSVMVSLKIMFTPAWLISYSTSFTVSLYCSLNSFRYSFLSLWQCPHQGAVNNAASSVLVCSAKAEKFKALKANIVSNKIFFNIIFLLTAHIVRHYGMYVHFKFFSAVVKLFLFRPSQFLIGLLQLLV